MKKAFLFFVFALTLSVSGLVIAGSAHAQEKLNTTEACNIPRDAEPVTNHDDRWEYCDIHMRQFAFREKQIDYRNQLKARQEAFRASTKSVHDRYKEALKQHHASLGD